MDADCWGATGTLYEAFRTYTKKQGAADRVVLSVQAFGRRMGDKFAFRKTKTVKLYQGVRLRSDQEEAAEARLRAAEAGTL